MNDSTASHDLEAMASGSKSEPHDPQWLSTEQQDAWRAWLRGSSLLFDALDCALAEHGHRMGEYEIMSMLSEAPGTRLRMSSLADRVVQSRSRLTHTAKRLESAGLVTRRRIREDGRGIELHLTPAGLSTLERMAPLHVESVRKGFTDLMTDEEAQVVADVMRRVILANRTSDLQGIDGLGEASPDDNDPKGTTNTDG
ncbi:MarR family winged helix-turn-helix transcriptional regulator [Ornithinimicrobium sp. INDO-MA30-4]|uniref:MarR family winged helix-turn-helix transcriptional regulator n=1 Tax=Ornithinimicrobium sp. INDO-MA30-4 TaxID=2908651 RepID=UPI001F466140|nr:MarR family transcriptional regulator [Ornithinimicrobium sp. INDO-MA30-4]UJH70516.1 MarR family transcriptional regulator [Ornithinimicrobium sp. INDO-MA30-4]